MSNPKPQVGDRIRVTHQAHQWFGGTSTVLEIRAFEVVVDKAELYGKPGATKYEHPDLQGKCVVYTSDVEVIPKGSRVDELIAQGAKQCSAKYHRVFIWPRDPVSWLKENAPEQYDDCVNLALKLFEEEATRVAVSINHHDRPIQLTNEEWKEFKLKTTGKLPFTAEDRTPCPDCESFGHMHRRDCKYFR